MHLAPQLLFRKLQKPTFKSAPCSHPPCTTTDSEPCCGAGANHKTRSRAKKKKSLVLSPVRLSQRSFPTGWMAKGRRDLCDAGSGQHPWVRRGAGLPPLPGRHLVLPQRVSTFPPGSPAVRRPPPCHFVFFLS